MVGRELDSHADLGDLDDPKTRAGWIVARLAAAREAWSAPYFEPAFMAALNLTPDSFSDGGELPDPAAVREAAQERVAEGASWLDLGAESTRPGAKPVERDEQLDRLLPAIEAVAQLGAEVSIDTRSASVAKACLDAGASMINDVSALTDPEMAPLVAERGCSVVIMHMRGTSADMHRHADYRFVVGEVIDEIAARVAVALEAGVAAERIVVDPGIGFAKTASQSLELQGRLGAFRALGLPVLAGPSRKSFMSDLLPGREAAERDGGTAGAAGLCAAQGAAILRLHRGGAVWDAVKVAAAAGAAAHRARIHESEALSRGKVETSA